MTDKKLCIRILSTWVELRQSRTLIMIYKDFYKQYDKSSTTFTQDEIHANYELQKYLSSQ